MTYAENVINLSGLIVSMLNRIRSQAQSAQPNYLSAMQHIASPGRLSQLREYFSIIDQQAQVAVQRCNMLKDVAYAHAAPTIAPMISAINAIDTNLSAVSTAAHALDEDSENQALPVFKQWVNNIFTMRIKLKELRSYLTSQPQALTGHDLSTQRQFPGVLHHKSKIRPAKPIKNTLTNEVQETLRDLQDVARRVSDIVVADISNIDMLDNNAHTVQVRAASIALQNAQRNIAEAYRQIQQIAKAIGETPFGI